MSTNHFIEITATQTHIVVLSNKRLILHIADAHVVLINGVALAPVSVEQQLWVWHTSRRIGRHLLMITRDTSVQIVTIECVSESVHHDVIMLLREKLSAIDVRLCAGQSALHATGVSHAEFAACIGMSVESFVRLIARYTHSPLPHSVHEWYGDGPVQLRMDRVVVRDATVVPFAYRSERDEQHGRVIISRLCNILQALEPNADYQVRDVIQEIRQRLLTPFHLSHAFVDLVTIAYQAVAQSLQPAVNGTLQLTADVALLYERWVWIVVLRALGCSENRLQQLIREGGDFCSDSGVMCAYQRRLVNTPNETGWSRDGRVAVPDVMLWQVMRNGTARACIIDAKCSFDARSPDQAAQNDVTAYLRRVGVGDSDPDVAVLVHPGHGLHKWPSGLIEVGTDGLHEATLVQIVHSWVQYQI